MKKLTHLILVVVFLPCFMIYHSTSAKSYDIVSTISSFKGGFEIPLVRPPQTPPKDSRGVYEEVFQSHLKKAPPVDTARYYTKLIYGIPKDRTYQQKYVDTLGKAVVEVQQWYAEHTLNGATFHFEPDAPLVDTLHLPHDAGWYNKKHKGISGNNERFYGFNNSKHDFLKVIKNYDDKKYVYVFYVDADFGGGGAGSSGFTTLGVKDLRGLEGLDKMPRSRWVGGMGHEMGHAFGLPHPPKFSGKYLMGTGYANYPDIDLTKANKKRLLNGKRAQFFYKPR